MIAAVVLSWMCTTFLIDGSSITLFWLMLSVSLGYEIHLVNPAVEIVADLLVDVSVDLLALDVLVFDCEVDVLDATLDVADHLCTDFLIIPFSSLLLMLLSILMWLPLPT